MSDNKTEKIIDNILCFMKQEIEKAGAQPETVSFDFSFSRNEKYFNGKEEIIPDGEDLQTLKKHYPKVKNNSWDKVLKLCLTHQYIDEAPCESNHKKIRITDKGMARAVSVSKQAPFKSYFKNLLLEHTIPYIISAVIVSLITLFFTYFNGEYK